MSAALTDKQPNLIFSFETHQNCFGKLHKIPNSSWMLKQLFGARLSVGFENSRCTTRNATAERMLEKLARTLARGEFWMRS